MRRYAFLQLALTGLVAAAQAGPAAAQYSTSGQPTITVIGERAPLMPPSTLTSESVPLVTLTFPAMITPRAETQLREAFRKLKWPYNCAGLFSLCPENESFLDQVIAKTAYLVPDVYAALTRELPANSVVVQPATLDVDAAGRFTYRVPNAELPSAVTLDFIAFVAPRIQKEIPSSAQTHGLYFLPVLVASRPPETRGSNAQLFAISHRVSASDVGPQPSALIQLATTALQKPVGAPQGVIAFKDKRLKIADAQWEHVESPTQVPGLVTELMAVELQPLVAAVKALDRQSVERNQLGRYASLYSGEIGKAGPIAWVIVPEFLNAEREFTNSEALAALEALRFGEFGESYRKTVRAEREQNKMAGRNMWLNTLTAFAGGYLAATSPDASSSTHMLTAVMDQQMARTRANEAYNSAVGGVSAAQRSVVVNFGQRQQTVSAGNIPELRQQFRALLIAAAAGPEDAISVTGSQPKPPKNAKGNRSR